MNNFQYVSAQTPGQAIDLIADKNGRYLAGGIDLLGEMKDYIISPDLLVDVKAMNGSSFKGIVAATTKAPMHVFDAGRHSGNLSLSGGGDTWSLSSLVTIAEIAAHPDIRAKLPGLAEAASEVGSPQIRNVATLGGNLLQHSRCWYYRQPDLVCLKRGGTTCYAHEGENKYLSLFSGCKCVTAFSSNLGVMLSALDGGVVFEGGVGKDAVPGPLVSLRSLYAKAWTDPVTDYSLKGSGLIGGILIPNNRTHNAYRQQSERHEFDWALVSCAAAANVKDGKIYDARVALGAVSPVPYMVTEAHHYLEGQTLNEETASKAADLILKDAKPLAQNGYKIPLAHTLIRRTLLALNT